jgi:hypothetical protein
MTDQNQEQGAKPAVAPPSRTAPGAEDLSAEIVESVERRPGDVVRCTRVVGDRYRCNWWAPESTRAYDNPTMVGLLVTTHRVRQSHFLRATKSTGRLVINVVTAS